MIRTLWTSCVLTIPVSEAIVRPSDEEQSASLCTRCPLGLSRELYRIEWNVCQTTFPCERSWEQTEKQTVPLCLSAAFRSPENATNTFFFLSLAAKDRMFFYTQFALPNLEQLFTSILSSSLKTSETVARAPPKTVYPKANGRDFSLTPWINTIESKRIHRRRTRKQLIIPGGPSNYYQAAG